MTPPLGFLDHFSAVSADYARYRPDYPDALFARLAGLAPSRRRAWDCATGSGQAAVGLAAFFEEVVATDASRHQLESARPHPRVRYRVASAEDSEIEAESVDLITVAQALHWLDRPRFWNEARRVLAPRGVVAVWCYEVLSVDPSVDSVIDRLYRGVVGPYWPAERAVVERGYGTLDFPFAEEVLPEFRMEKDWTLRELEGYLRTWSAAKRYREAVGADPLEVVRRDLEDAWGEPERARRAVWRLDLRAGRKT